MKLGQTTGVTMTRDLTWPELLTWRSCSNSSMAAFFMSSWVQLVASVIAAASH